MIMIAITTKSTTPMIMATTNGSSSGAAIAAVCGAAPPTGGGPVTGLMAAVYDRSVLYTVGIQTGRLINWRIFRGILT